MKAFYMKDQETGAHVMEVITMKDPVIPAVVPEPEPERILYVPGSRVYPASVIPKQKADPNAVYKPGSGIITVLPPDDQDKFWRHTPGTQRYVESTRKRDIGGWI